MTHDNLYVHMRDTWTCISSHEALPHVQTSHDINMGDTPTRRGSTARPYRPYRRTSNIARPHLGDAGGGPANDMTRKVWQPCWQSACCLPLTCRRHKHQPITKRLREIAISVGCLQGEGHRSRLPDVRRNEQLASLRHNVAHPVLAMTYPRADSCLFRKGWALFGCSKYPQRLAFD